MPNVKFSVIEGGVSLAERQTRLEQQFKADLSRSCAYGNVSLLRQTINNPLFQRFIPEVVYANTGPCTAARNGHLNALVELIHHASFLQHCPADQVQYYMDEMFLYATLGEHLPVMRYLLDEATLAARAQLDAVDKRAFFMSCRGSRAQAIEFFIKERKLRISPLDRLEVSNDPAISDEIKALVTALDAQTFGTKAKAHLSLVI